METDAAVLINSSEPLQLQRLKMPALKTGQVLVEVVYSGLCQSQLLEIRGKRGEDRFLPHTLGHEGSGIVREVGPGVQKVKSGDPVVLSWMKSAGLDVPSTTYFHDRTPVNSGAISTLMRHTVTCENRLTPIPRDMPLREAALLGCAIPTGAGIVMNTAKVSAGNTVAVFGLGGVGLSAVLAARIMDASKIIAIDIFDHKLAQAERLGATHLINAKNEQPLDAIRRLTEGNGVDFSIEAAGRRETMEMAIDAARIHGGLCVIAGNLAAGERISINPFDLIQGKRVIGSWGGESYPERDIPRYIDLYLQGKLKLESMITHTFPLNDINEAFSNLENGKVGRALIEMAL